jgi:hypothetical protein
MRKNESVKHFSDRYQRLLREAKKSDDDPDYFQHYLSRLPLEIRRFLLIEFHQSNSSEKTLTFISILIQKAIAYDSLTQSWDQGSPAKPATNEGNCPLHPNGNHNRNECRKLRSSSRSSTKCPLHPNSSHSADQCRKMKQDGQQNSGPVQLNAATHTNKREPKPVTCFKCHKSGHYANACPNSCSPTLARVDLASSSLQIWNPSNRISQFKTSR